MMSEREIVPEFGNKVSRLAALFGFSILLIALTRLPFMPAHLFSFDSVNLALALDHFDPTIEQPQPPGYPLFVFEARLLNHLFGDPQQTFAVLGIAVCGLAVAMLYLVGKELFSPRVGMVAAALLFVNPPFWYSSLTSGLRPHLALVSAVVAYFCWRTKQGERGPLYAASIALGVGGGARPELFLLLLPLWIWAAWQTRDRRAIVRGGLILAGSALFWAAIILMASGGPQRAIAYFMDYLVVQTEHTSVVLDPSTSWRRAVGRAVIWTGLGAVPWLWTLPLAWKSFGRTSDWIRKLVFLLLWFAPIFGFFLAVHVADPDHTLAIIPPLCLVGGIALVEAEKRVARAWMPQVLDGGLFVWVALVGNLVLFFGEMPLPQRNPVAEFRGLTSASDAARIGTYETSYAKVRWIEQMTDLGLKSIAELKSTTSRPVWLIWLQDGEPVWRKLGVYFPEQPMYVLMEADQLEVHSTEARFYAGSRLVKRYTGQTSLLLPVPKGARLIWVAGANQADALRGILPVQSFSSLQYIDLPVDSPSIRWGPFEIVPE